jgi:hypothetical protein
VEQLAVRIRILKAFSPGTHVMSKNFDLSNKQEDHHSNKACEILIRWRIPVAFATEI